MTRDIFEPRVEPHRTFYRIVRDAMAPTEGERRLADYKAAVRSAHTVIATDLASWALANGYARGPLTVEVERLEQTALGHVDYAAKYACALVDWFRDHGRPHPLSGAQP